jgi:hypothetical protein
VLRLGLAELQLRRRKEKRRDETRRRDETGWDGHVKMEV